LGKWGGFYQNALIEFFFLKINYKVMKKYIRALVLSLVFNLLYAQKEINIWHFRSQAALNFNSGSPLDESPSSMFSI